MHTPLPEIRRVSIICQLDMGLDALSLALGPVHAPRCSASSLTSAASSLLFPSSLQSSLLMHSSRELRTNWSSRLPLCRLWLKLANF
eukprot:scaffold17530_cov23-Tisochrysis_lutea.AAC.3